LLKKKTVDVARRKAKRVDAAKDIEDKYVK